MAFAAFADAPVDVAVVEVGLGGTWDATNVLSAPVAVMTPIALDHMDELGDTVAEIATDKAGIIHEGASLSRRSSPSRRLPCCSAAPSRSVRRSRARASSSVCSHRQTGVGGQLLTLRGLAAVYDDIRAAAARRIRPASTPPARSPLEAFLGAEPDPTERGCPRRLRGGRVTGPARDRPPRPDDRARRRAQPGRRRGSRGGPGGVVCVRPAGRRGRDVVGQGRAGLAGALEPDARRGCRDQRTRRRARCRPTSSPRLAIGVFGRDRVEVVERLDDAIEAAVGSRRPARI